MSGMINFPGSRSRVIDSQELGVTDRSSLVSAENSFSLSNVRAYSFNGFMFFSFSGARSTTPNHGDAICSITDANFRPSINHIFPSISHEGDLVNIIVAQTDGDVIVSYPSNSGASDFYVAINGFYRYG